MIVAIIDYGSGNLRSAAKAFERVVRDDGLKAEVHVSNDPDFVRRADRIVLPGVGAYGACAAGLWAIAGMVAALEEVVVEKARPFLGICVGMQLLADVGREFGNHRGLGWIAGEVIALERGDPALKIPHMGWNELIVPDDRAHAVLSGIETGDHAYFVHSYHYRTDHNDHVLAEAAYGQTFSAIVGRDNMVGTQFHPEKSQRTGLRLISGFLTWMP